MGDNKQLSANSKWCISHERTMELVHFCRQYPEWSREYRDICNDHATRDTLIMAYRDKSRQNRPVEDIIMRGLKLLEKMDLVDHTAFETSREISKWLRKGVIEGLSYDAMNALDPLPVSRDVYYDIRREFFYRLALKR